MHRTIGGAWQVWEHDSLLVACETLSEARVFIHDLMSPNTWNAGKL